MITPEQVPKKVVKAAQKAWEKDTESFRPTAKTIAAALNAWPGMEQDQLFHGFTDGTHYFQPRLILPLPQEASDDKA
ncbi:hypothetical protein UFOVP1087_5 [uncultured Caudovirales phage]|uniref:Uncharacterized protein n=1 Tax=uncultured Caudovirales phage TaxID=2100421 RepID=A0A6J5PDL0_9CAUD|nr:hypothetical protein UFOVP910_20 [uncultured Caudovirales phage]CAB4182442.1 hypothetical protein UFOVP1087_5 [uncultured Caudovirales phage]CAB5228282.1 hypothetical protein UFOVP1534_41 [uncultured Caudovirales phage]